MPAASYIDGFNPSSPDYITNEYSADPQHTLSDPPEGSFYQLMVPRNSGHQEYSTEEVYHNTDGSDEIDCILGSFLLQIPESNKGIYIDIIVRWMLQPGRTASQIVSLIQRFTKPQEGLSSAAALYLTTALSKVLAELNPRHLTGSWMFLLKFVIKHSNYIEYNSIMDRSGSGNFKIWVIEALSDFREFPDSYTKLEMVLFFNLFICIDNPHPFTWNKIVEVFVNTVSQLDSNGIQSSNLGSLQLIVWKIENIIKYFHRNGYLTDLCSKLITQIGIKFVTQEMRFITTLLDIAGKLATLSLRTKKSDKITQASNLLDNDKWFDLRVDLKQSLRIIELFTFIPAFNETCKEMHLIHHVAASLADITDAITYYNTMKPIIREHELDIMESRDHIVASLSPVSTPSFLPNLLMNRQYDAHNIYLKTQLQNAAQIVRLQVQDECTRI